MPLGALTLVVYPERTRRDAELLLLIKAAWEGSEERYGARKVWHELQRKGVVVARCP